MQRRLVTFSKPALQRDDRYKAVRSTSQEPGDCRSIRRTLRADDRLKARPHTPFSFAGLESFTEADLWRWCGGSVSAFDYGRSLGDADEHDINARDDVGECALSQALTTRLMEVVEYEQANRSKHRSACCCVVEVCVIMAVRQSKRFTLIEQRLLDVVVAYIFVAWERPMSRFSPGMASEQGKEAARGI
jgi:hypothetical protein